MGGLYSSPEGARAVESRYRELLARWPVPHEQVRVPTAQGETFAVTCGPVGAPPLLLLHGSASTSAMWLGDVATWARRFRVHAVDLIGEPGLSAPSRPPLDPGTYAGWLGEVLAGLGARRVRIVAVSLGGWTALAFATRRPEQVERLALLCPSGIGRQRVLPLLRALPLMALGGEGGRRHAMRLILGPQAAGLGSAGEMGEFALLIHRHFRPRHGRLPVFPDADLRRLTMPMLVVTGDRDSLLDSGDTRRRLAGAVPGADVRVLPGTGHLLPPQTQEIMNFLESVHA
ncbi:alpha/beta fold hydrolase [Nonomuraea gerenzanensis]|uniref:Carboxylesterase NP n=1 Tax=Nonomuraea gerenzanensis TaxID=93944 RepID=A0A1M4EET9_9ACTN|nr:alpha/beta hydrolase [Nonomuraea gerenzanensis]UBU08951.1 alpha/beta hydrolase [Nonomuraea gerenzanensis]SBO97330.1 carboxylesterase NP [Nonomuraea gerenzanensis]